MKNILVTGGAGYIGSHAVKALLKGGYGVTVIDNLSKGHAGSINEDVKFFEMDLRDFDSLLNLFGSYTFDAVMHFAGSTEVGLSMDKPAEFLANNVSNGGNLLEAMRINGVNKIIFSSTAAVYGNPENIPIKEDDPLDPTNFYGVTKLMFENLLKKYDRFWGLKYAALRYFNAAGADESGEIGEDHDPETHLIPRILLTLLGQYDQFKLYGTDYKTKDGTCVRDYVHVTDLVDAHLKALEFLFGENESDTFNLGNGSGFSVKEVIDAVRKVTGKEVIVRESARREGDPAILVADSNKAKDILKWKPEFFVLEKIIETAWKWHYSHPEGYQDAMS